jgi:arylsulfatase A-like enzyme
VGRILETLERLDLAENTLLIVFSDNGGLSEVTSNAPLRAGKQTLYEGGLRVPLIVRWPGHVRPGSRSDTPVISHDLFPTLVEAAGLDASVPDLDGVSLLRLLEESGTLEERPLFFYYPHYARRPGAVVREGSYKLIEHYDPPGVELYDLARDLGEETDLASAMPERVELMRAQLERWLDGVGAIRHRPNPEAAAGARPPVGPGGDR